MPDDRPTPVRFYDSTIPSGNAYKVHLLLSHLELKRYEIVELDILANPPETRGESFLAKNPNGRIPVLDLSDGTCLAESNAILCYLADDTPLLPRDPLERARVFQWLFFEQYSHERFIAVLKFWTYWGDIENKPTSNVENLRENGQRALDVMERHLANRNYFVGERYSIADIALFAYTQSAADLGFDVGKEVSAWLERVRAEPGFEPMKRDPLGRAPHHERA